MAEPLKATFFTFKRRDRAVLLPATLIFIAVMALIVGGWIGLNWATFGTFFDLIQQGVQQGQTQGQMNEAQAMAMFSGMMGLFLSTILLLIPGYMVVACYEAACLRWMIRGEAPGLFGLNFDNDMWRVWGIYWCWLVVNLAVGMVCSMLMFPFMFMMLGEIAAQGPAPDPEAMWQMNIKMQAISLIQYIPLAFLGVRFGPAAATSVARRRFSFLEAWTVTAGRFWSLFGSFAVLWLIAGIVYAALFAATSGVLFRDVIQQLIASWPDVSAETVQAITDRATNPSSYIFIGAGYAGGALLWIAYTLLAFGVNARAALVALEEEKITVAPPET